MSDTLYVPQKAFRLFGHEATPEASSLRSSLPPFARSESSGRALKSWSLQQLPFIGEACGFMPRPQRSVCAAVFVSKGGVLKTSLTLNIARLAALHNIRVCVVGLDMQGDATTALQLESADDAASASDETWEQALERLGALRGLPDIFAENCSLEDAILPTDIPTLSYIPETPELVALDQSLVNRNRREYWLREKVIEPLKTKFDLILLDCPPNWNRLIVNALMACDALVSPLECKINNFRNFKAFQGLMREFRSEMGAEFRHVFAPTRLSSGRKLSQEIYQWYLSNLANCAQTAIRDSSHGEEASALRVSIPEHVPASPAADEMRALVQEIWPILAGLDESAPKPVSRSSASTSANAALRRLPEDMPCL